VGSSRTQVLSVPLRAPEPQAAGRPGWRRPSPGRRRARSRSPDGPGRPEGRRLLVRDAESWDGRGWTVEPIPTPAGSASSQLSAVGCPRPASCHAAGVFWERSPIGQAFLADVERRDLDRRAGPRPRPARDRVGLHRPGDDTARPGMNTGQLGERRGLPGGWKEAAPHRRWLSSRYPCGQVLELCVDEELPEDEDVDDGLEDALGVAAWAMAAPDPTSMPESTTAPRARFTGVSTLFSPPLR